VRRNSVDPRSSQLRDTFSLISRSRLTWDRRLIQNRPLNPPDKALVLCVDEHSYFGSNKPDREQLGTSEGLLGYVLAQ